ncbi:unnamed protein product [Lactuca saligna]|uniref:Uncharacterized protein n=1 Tax=Lactuca saligna TaxID=75948 RepID=A0AA35VM90_LACSI|nr:unnamed protein product [Lactuca saligna]
MVARIPDAMLQKINPAHPMLVNYLKTISTNVETGVLLPSTVDPSKLKRGSKKSTTESPSKPSPTKVGKVIKPKNFETLQEQGTSNLVISSTLTTSTIDTSISLPPFVSTTPVVTHSPTFDNILNQPITSLFSSQSTDPPITHEEEEAQSDDEKEFDGTFANLEFDPEKENILDSRLLTGKQFKILNRKLNSLLQIQADSGNKHSVSSLEVYIMLKRQEHRLHEAILDVDRNNEKRNYRYITVRENNVVFDFSVADFPLMNVYDLLIVAKILKSIDYSKLQQGNKEDFMIGFEHLRVFIDGYYGALALTDIDLATTLGKKAIVPKSMIKNQYFLKDYEDGEI